MSGDPDRWDGEELLERFDAETGATILIALHSSRLGPSSGGTRMKTYPDLAAARRAERTVVLSVGRLVSEKGHDVLV